MLIDLTIKVNMTWDKNASIVEQMVSFGHLGTHFDVMNKEFPLVFTKRNALVFDVSGIVDRDIELSDIDIDLVREDMFVALYTGFIEKEEYGTKTYFESHPQLSNELIDGLLHKKVSIIGIDFAGVRRGKEHTPKDQYCADRGAFVIENLCNLSQVLNLTTAGNFLANTYPINFEGLTGLPCRVVAETLDEEFKP